MDGRGGAAGRVSLALGCSAGATSAHLAPMHPLACLLDLTFDSPSNPPASEPVEYKYVVVSEQSGAVAWQPGANRVLSLPGTNSQVRLEARG